MEPNEAAFREFTHDGVHHVARVTLHPGRGGWGRIDIWRGSLLVGCGEFSKRGLVYLTWQVKPMRPLIEQLIEHGYAWA